MPDVTALPLSSNDTHVIRNSTFRKAPAFSWVVLASTAFKGTCLSAANTHVCVGMIGLQTVLAGRLVEGIVSECEFDPGRCPNLIMMGVPIRGRLLDDGRECDIPLTDALRLCG